MIVKLENSSLPRHRLAGKKEPPSRPHVVVDTRPSANSGNDALHNLSMTIIALFEFVVLHLRNNRFYHSPYTPPAIVMRLIVDETSETGNRTGVLGPSVSRAICDLSLACLYMHTNELDRADDYLKHLAQR